MKHVVFFSGGSGSYEVVRRLLQQGINHSDIHLLFTDTFIEDKSLYVFLCEAFQKVYKKSLHGVLTKLEELPEVYQDMDLRCELLSRVASEVMEIIPNIHWLHYQYEGEYLTPWGIFERQKFIGNSRIAPCSTLIKQRLAREYFKQVFVKEEVQVYFGIDWSESHRMKTPSENWGRYASRVLFPLNEAPYTSSKERLENIQEDGLQTPRLYLKGFSHNNCGGFCVRAGQGHFLNLKETLPDVFEYHASKEAELSQKLQSTTGEVYTILTKQVQGVKKPLPLNLLGLEQDIDRYDIGGCGCFVTEDVEDTEVNFSVSKLEIFKGYSKFK